MDFGDALKAIRSGSLVARNGWNGKGMWLALVCVDDYSIHDSGDYMPPNFGGRLLPWIGLQNASGDFTPWAPSQEDMLSEDWMILKDKGGWLVTLPGTAG